MRLRHIVGLVALLSATACDDAQPAEEAAKDDGSAKQVEAADPEAEAETDPKDAAAPKAQAELDVCASLTAADVQAAIGVTDALDASKEHMRVMGTFDGWCAYRAGTVNRAQVSVAPDPDRKDFGKLEAMAAPDSPLLTPAEPIDGNAAVARSDGSLIWHAGGRLYTVAVLDDKGMPTSDDASRVALARAAAAKLTP